MLKICKLPHTDRNVVRTFICDMVQEPYWFDYSILKCVPIDDDGQTTNNLNTRQECETSCGTLKIE